MRIAIHNNKAGFTNRWVKYCEKHSIDFVLIDIFSSNAINELNGCDALFWHLSHERFEDGLISMGMMSALETKGLYVFPSPAHLWHFDDKLAQKYFFELHGFPIPKTDVFFNKTEAHEYLKRSKFPIIGKLRRGSASSNVFLIDSASNGKALLNKAFSKGFPLYNISNRYKDKLHKSKGLKEKSSVLLKWIYRHFFPPAYSKKSARENGYFMFQEFIPNNGEDIRVAVVGERAVALRRKVRSGDFRASGSGILEFPNENLNKEYISLAFQIVDKLGVDSMGIDFIESLEGEIKVIEMSYGFPSENFLDGSAGSWNRNLEFNREKIQLQEWMIDMFFLSREG